MSCISFCHGSQCSSMRTLSTAAAIYCVILSLPVRIWNFGNYAKHAIKHCEGSEYSVLGQLFVVYTSFERSRILQRKLYCHKPKMIAFHIWRELFVR